MLDRYAKRVAGRSPRRGDVVVASIPRLQGEEWKDSREIGVIDGWKEDEQTKGRLLYVVKMKDDVLPKSQWEEQIVSKEALEVLSETTYFQICDRVVSGVLQKDTPKWFSAALKRFLYEEAFIPAGRILAGVGNSELNLTFFNCFVKRILEDSRKGIADHWATIFEIFSRGGGCGWNLSILRPKYSPVRGVNGKSSGVCSWATHFAAITNTVEQGGSRRGASLQAIDIWHPDVIEFIRFKSEREQFNCPSCDHQFSKEKNLWKGSNVSIILSDAFMQAVKDEALWDLVFPDTSDPDYDQVWEGDIEKWKKLGKKVLVYQTIPAKELWDLFIDNAWKCGDPGVLFLDRSNYFSNSWYYNKLICTNPCGEQVLPENGICNLGHLNLPKFLIEKSEDRQFPKNGGTASAAKTLIDLPKLTQAIRVGVRFLDTVIDINQYHDPQMEKTAKDERRIGLGILGYGELLIRCGLEYGSAEALKFTSWLFEEIRTASYLTSSDLAKEKGPFRKYNTKKYLSGKFIQTLPATVRKAIQRNGMRNVTVNTVAPTGSVGTMVGTSTGFEPYFSFQYTARSRIGSTNETINIFEELSRKFGEDSSSWPSYVVTADEISIQGQVSTQACIQEFVDSSISKTINLPENASHEDVSKAFMLMYDSGCKGGTIYRDKSKDEQVLYRAGKKAEEKIQSLKIEGVESIQDDQTRIVFIDASECTSLLRAPLIRQKSHSISDSIETPVGKLHAFLRFHPVTGEPYDFFCQSGKGDVSADVQAFGRLVSVILRWPDKMTIPQEVRLQILVNQLCGIHGRSQVGIGPEAVYSLPDAIGKFLNDYLSASFPLPGIPLGEEKLDEFARKMANCKHKDQLVEYIKTGIVKEEQSGCGGEGCTCKKQEEALIEIKEVKEVKEGKAQRGKRMEYCPRCGNASLVKIPGHCTYCTNQQCNYSEC